jgi:hypothetical protein
MNEASWTDTGTVILQRLDRLLRHVMRSDTTARPALMCVCAVFVVTVGDAIAECRAKLTNRTAQSEYLEKTRLLA